MEDGTKNGIKQIREKLMLLQINSQPFQTIGIPSSKFASNFPSSISTWLLNVVVHKNLEALIISNNPALAFIELKCYLGLKC